MTTQDRELLKNYGQNQNNNKEENDDDDDFLEEAIRADFMENLSKVELKK